MNRKLLIIIAILALAAGGVSFGLTRSYASQDEVASVLKDIKGNAIQQVILNNDTAAPDAVSVPVGQSVQFNVADGQKHRMGFGAGGHEHQEDNLYDSGEFGAGESWRVAFNKPGTYQFHDHLNPNISVLVVAYQP